MTEIEEIKKHLIYSSLAKRVKTPTVIQMEVVECAAAVLSILLEYYGCFVTLEELRYQCGVSRDGSNAYNLIEAAKHYGMAAEGYRVAIGELPNLKAPFILHWSHNHFVVFEGCDSRGIFINDPATGPRQVTYQEFVKNYSLIAITVFPTRSFKKRGTAPKFWKLLKSRLSYAKGSTFIFLISLQLILVLVGLSFPTLSRIFVDQILSHLRLSWQWIFLGFMLLMILIQTAAKGIQGITTNRSSRRLSTLFSTDFLWHVLRLPFLFFSQRFGGEVINRMNLNEPMVDFINQRLSISLINLSLIFIYGLVMLLYDPMIALVGVGIALSCSLLFFLIARARENAYYRLQQEYAKSVGISMDILQHMEMIKAVGMESSSFSKLINCQIQNFHNKQDIGKKQIWLNATTAFFLQLSAIFLLTFGAWRIMGGYLSTGMLLALQILMASFLAPFNQLINLGINIQSLKIDLLRLNDVLQHKPDPLLQERQQEKMEPTKLKGKLSVENISFGYSPRDNPLLSHLNLSLEPGKKVALVGLTGCGKSTLAKVISGLLSPWSGVIKYDDIPLQKLPREIFIRSVAWIDQEPMIFSGSIQDNLTLWDKRFSEEELEKATTDALFYEVIKGKTFGYQEMLSETGSNLSQGEKQRLEIARALLLNPSLLILDEAMSALEAQAEEKIFQNIKQRECTVLLITHRLNVIQQCDWIYVMDQGQIVQEGMHEQLKNRAGIYQEMSRLNG